MARNQGITQLTEESLATAYGRIAVGWCLARLSPRMAHVQVEKQSAVDART